jgi:hypothetical protein
MPAIIKISKYPPERNIGSICGKSSCEDTMYKKPKE